MSCDCGDACTVWDQRTVKARKVHRCSECGETINPGEEYERIGSLFDGEWDTFKLCDCCWHDWKHVTSIGHCWDIGNLEGVMAEMYEEAKPIVVGPVKRALGVL